MSPTLELIDRAELIKQGAEARVYKLPIYFPSPSVCWPSNHPESQASSSSSSSLSASPIPLLLKHRFPKKYRHPHLDSLLTKQRIQAESRSLLRCLKQGITTPQLRMVDADCGMIGMEWIDGWSVREVLGGGAEGEEEPSDYNNDGNAEEEEARILTPVEEAKKKRREEAESVLAVLNVSVSDLMASIGHLLAKMHLANIVHGDLTTSNMMLRPLTVDSGTESKPYEIVLIDFGLASASNVAENLAVDLYVLERAFGSTHPASEQWFDGILQAYAKGLGEKKWTVVGARLDEVRLRGRKRDMIG